MEFTEVVRHRRMIRGFTTEPLPDGSIVIIALPAIFRGVHLDRWRRATSATCCG